MWVQVPLSLKMKIEREKRIRAKYIENEVERVVGKMMKTVTGKGESSVRMSYRNICKETGRSRGVISGKVRME